MEEFKKSIYSKYYSTHNQFMYEKPTLNNIELAFPIWKHRFAKHLPVQKDAAVLDLGCGNGAFVYFLHCMGFQGSLGVDISAEQIELGNALGIKCLQCCDIHQFLVDKTEYYDLIIARDVIEHFTRQETFELLSIIFKALKPGGKFLMQVPNGQGIFYTTIFFGDYTHEMAYTTTSVRQLFLNVGFFSTQCFPIEPVPNSIAGVIRFLLWRLKTLSVRFWKMIETGNSSGIFTANLIAIGIKK